MDSLSWTSLVPCPQTISFPLSVVAPDPHLHLIGRRLLSLLRPVVSLPLSTLASRSIRPAVPFVWSPPTSTRFPALGLFFRQSLFHIARGRFLDQFCFCVAKYTIACVHPGYRCALRPRSSSLSLCYLMFHPLPVLTFFPPHRSLLNHSVRSGRALVHPPCFPRISFVLSLSAA